MKFIQIRHASCIIELDNIRFLIDPIFYKKNTLSPVEGGINKNNPLIDITIEMKLLENIDSIILTHLHRDHFDPEIIKIFGKDIPVICQSEYENKLSELGFINLHLVNRKIQYNDIEIECIKGEHGIGEVGISMGNTYGFILKKQNNEVIYLTGDTIWCKNVEEAIEKYKPKIIIGFAGSAMVKNVHITLDENDIKTILDKNQNIKLIVNHMDAWNHCFLTKEKLTTLIQNKNLYIPNDGEVIDI